MATIGSNIQSQLNTGYFKYGYLVKVSLSGITDINLTTAPRNITYNGEIYYSAATLGIGGIREALQMETNEITISLSGITQTYIAVIQRANFIGGWCQVFQIFFSETDDSILDDPVLFWEGKILESGISYDWSSKSASISVQVGDYFSRFNNPVGPRTNPTEWKQTYPADKIFDQIPIIASKDINF